MRKKVIIDTDPGIDDALAILLALGDPDKLDIKLMTSTCGNVPISRCTKNLLYLCEQFAEYDIPVAEGENHTGKSLATEVHGETGLGEVKITSLNKKKLDVDACTAIYDILSASNDKVILVALGPLTNYAKLLKEHPDSIDKIDYIFFMGASMDGKGNVTPYAEFNVYNNPTALKEVLQSGVKMVFSPMHLGEDCMIEINDILSHTIETKKAEFLHDMFLGANEPCYPGKFSIYDTQVILGLNYPELYHFEKCNIKVTTEGEKAGQTFITPCKNGKHLVQLTDNVELIKKIILEELYL